MKKLNRMGVLFLGLIVAMTGCKKNPATSNDNFSDGTAGYVSQEIADMGNSAEFGLSGGQAKAVALAAVAADTIRYSLQVTRRSWAYNATSGWWVREIEVTLNDGRKITKIDSIQFRDSNANSIQHPTWAAITGWVHYRHVERVGLLATHNMDFSMTVTLSKGTDTTAIWNGNITGKLNGEQLSSTTVSDVVRQRAPGYWIFPSSGNITMDRPLRTIVIDFTGNGNATATITRKSDNRTKIITINVSTGEETES